MVPSAFLLPEASKGPAGHYQVAHSLRGQLAWQWKSSECLLKGKAQSKSAEQDPALALVSLNVHLCNTPNPLLLRMGKQALHAHAMVMLCDVPSSRREKVLQ